MTIEIFLIFLLLLTFSFGLVWYIKFTDERNYNLYLHGKLNPYKRKSQFLSDPELKLFNLLNSLNFNNEFYIFPQLHLSTLLMVKNEAIDMKGKFDWLNSLYVDFVLFDKKSMEAKLVIELNDKTHFWNNRKARDEFVEKSLTENGIPFLKLSFFDLDHPNEINRIIKQQLEK